jgi:uncharacterized membrane protein
MAVTSRGQRRPVLLAGETWITHSIHQKGFDSFTTTSYHDGALPLVAALRDGDFEVERLANHVAGAGFPTTLEELRRYSAVVLSDIGANTLLLHPDTFDRSIPRPDRLSAIREYVAEGGGLVMIGGYLSFQGIEAKGQWAGTAVEAALPVTIERHDDRVEAPQGVAPIMADGSHEITAGLPREWPVLLGYNRVRPRDDASVLVRVGDDPLIVAGQFGRGRSVAFTSDCGPHWCPPPFVAWDGYARIWRQLLGWVQGGPSADRPSSRRRVSGGPARRASARRARPAQLR